MTNLKKYFTKVYYKMLHDIHGCGEDNLILYPDNDTINCQCKLCGKTSHDYKQWI